MFYPCHNKKNKNKENNPSPKSTRWGWVKRLQFDTYTTHRLLAEIKGLWVRMTHVTRRIRTRRTPNFFRTQNVLEPKFFGPKVFLKPKICSDQKLFFRRNYFFTYKIYFCTQNFVRTKKNFRTKSFFGPKILSDQKLFQT